MTHADEDATIGDAGEDQVNRNPGHRRLLFRPQLLDVSHELNQHGAREELRVMLSLQASKSISRHEMLSC